MCRIYAVGIIPARAGFTLSDARTLMLLADHPRSRGVYVDFGMLSEDAAGSSPLARGLLGEVGRSRDLARIIPARAGFTWSRRTR